MGRQYSSKKNAVEPIWVYGLHSVRACLHSQPENIVEVLVAQPVGDGQLFNELLQLGIAVQTVAATVLDQRFLGARHQGFVARLKQNITYTETDLLKIISRQQQAGAKLLLLILDGVTDPRNLGACLRSANGVAVDAVIVPKDKASGLTAVVRKTASGAAETTPLIQVTNLARLLRELQTAGIWVLGASDAATETVYQQDLTMDIALVLGAEDKGLRRLTADNCDKLVALPMLGTVSSLNVSVAAAVCLYEALRQRGYSD